MSLLQRGKLWRPLLNYNTLKGSRVIETLADKLTPYPASCSHLGLQQFRWSQPIRDFLCSSPFSTASSPLELDNSESTAQTQHPGEQEQKQGVSKLIEMLEERDRLISSLKTDLEEQRRLIKNILQEISLIKSSQKNQEEVHVGTEWIAFIENLKECGFLKSSESSSSDGIKDAIANFCEAHESIFKSLPEKDLRVLSEYGNIAEDTKNFDSLKKLRAYLQHDGQTVPVGSPTLLDVTNVLHSFHTVSEDALSYALKLSIVHTLRNIVVLSNNAKAKAPDCREVRQYKEGKVSNSYASTELDSTEEGTAGAITKPQLWTCPRCSFKNLDHKYRCVECSRRRPTKTYPKNKETTVEDSLDTDLDSKKSANEKHKKKPLVKEDVTELCSTDDDDFDCKKSDDQANSSDEDSEHFDILDDILESEDSDSDQDQDNNKKTSLSELFSRKPSSGTSKGSKGRNDFQRKQPFGQKKFKEDSNKQRKKHDPSDNEEEVSDEDAELQPRKPGRRFNNHEDDGHFQRRGNGYNDYNSSRRRGGSSSYGGNRGKGNSYDDEYTDGGRSSYGGRRERFDDKMSGNDYGRNNRGGRGGRSRY